MTTSHVRSAGRSVAALVILYIVGNLAALWVSWYLVKLDLRLAHLIPWIFLFIPIGGIALTRRAGLLAKSFKFRDASIALIGLCIVTWLVVLYIYLLNMYPGVF